jgi:hypothetical protein
MYLKPQQCKENVYRGSYWALSCNTKQLYPKQENDDEPNDVKASILLGYNKF